MKTVFDRETELGRCSEDYVNGPEVSFSIEPWIIVAQTNAVLTGTRGLFKLEQRCYLRRGEDILDQPWLKPEIQFEPARASEAEMAAFAAEAHKKFVQKAHEEVPEAAFTPA